MPFPILSWIAITAGAAFVAAIASSDSSSSSSSNSSAKRRELERENERKRQQALAEKKAQEQQQKKARQQALAEHKAQELIHAFSLKGIDKKELAQLAINNDDSLARPLANAFEQAAPHQALKQKIAKQRQKLDELEKLSLKF